MSLLASTSRLARSSAALARGARSAYTRPTKPWAPREPPPQLPTPTTLEGFTNRMATFTRASGDELSVLLILCREMKAASISPNRQVFVHLLRVLGTKGMANEAWAVYHDMLGCKIKPDLEAFGLLLNAYRFEPAAKIQHVMDEIKRHELKPDASLYSLLINRCVFDDNLEGALDVVFQMAPLIPTIHTYGLVIDLAGRMGSPKLALDMAKMFPEDIPSEVWVNLLIACSDNLWAEGVQECWSQVVSVHEIIPDEGCCVKVLHTAARAGLPELATDALQMIKATGAKFKEHHFAPVIEAMVNGDRLASAFEILSTMRSHGLPPTSQTTNSIYLRLSTDETVFDSVWDTVDTMVASEKKIDPSILHCIVKSAVGLNDLQRAVGAYKAFDEFNVKSTTETCNSLLKGCVGASHRTLGDQLLREMKPKGLVPDVETYTRMCQLCLTQDAYEDAFFYLEETKAAGFRPTYATYEALVLKCLDANDERWKIALEELEGLKYRKSPALKKALAKAERNALEVETTSEDAA